MCLTKEIVYRFTTSEAFFRAMDEIEKKYPTKNICGWVKIEKKTLKNRINLTFEQIERKLTLTDEDLYKLLLIRNNWKSFKDVKLKVEEKYKENWLHGKVIIDR